MTNMTAEAPPTPETFAALGLFRELPAAALAEIRAVARVRHLPKDARVFSQGDEGVRAHTVIEGAVRIGQTGSDGGQVLIRFISPGEMFGTVSLFTDGRYPADAITLTQTVEASWSEPELLGLIHRHPQVGVNAIRIVGSRLQEVQERVRELATQRADRRVAHALLRLARQAGRQTALGMTIEFPLRRKDVAALAGTTLHTASRVLTAWQKAGLVSTRNLRLTLRQPAELLRIADKPSD